MKNYYKVRLGKLASHLKACIKDNFIGADYHFNIDFTNQLTEQWNDFKKKFVPLYLKEKPDKSKISAGLACGALWTIGKGIKIGDIVLCPDGYSKYLVGEVISEYSYHTGEILPHRRKVKWFEERIDRSIMSDTLQLSIGTPQTVSRIDKYADEIETLLSGKGPAVIVSTDETIEDVSVFALEKHLEDFLVKNWAQTELGKDYDILEEDGELVGQQFQSDTGPIDILAIRKDKKELLVIELKKGRASDVVVGQIQRYMGYVAGELAEDNQSVRGIIIALEDDVRIQRALSVASNIDFYRYQVSFKLFKS